MTACQVIDNPFATRWTRPGAMPFHFPPGEDAPSLVRRLIKLGWQGAIVGPHGSGKSTLLATLIPLLRQADRVVRQITLRADARRLRRDLPARCDGGPAVWVIDGYEQLGRRDRWRLHRWRRSQGAGFLVASHRPSRVPTLITLVPQLPIAIQLVRTLTRDEPMAVSAANVAASFHRHDGNIRDMLFELYDLHERSRRA